MAKDVTKATVAIKAESLASLIEALERIAEEANMRIVQNANVSTSIALESEDDSDLGLAISDIASAINRTVGVECKVSAPGSVWHERRIDPTPMEVLINRATGEIFT
jgi:transcriptional regulatory protein LevR